MRQRCRLVSRVVFVGTGRFLRRGLGDQAFILSADSAPYRIRMDHDQNGELEAERGRVCCVLMVIVCVCCCLKVCVELCVCVCPLSVDSAPRTLRLSVYFQDLHSSLRRASTSRV